MVKYYVRNKSGSFDSWRNERYLVNKMARTSKENISEDLDFQTWWLLHQTRDVVFRLRSRELNQYGISAEQAAILFAAKFLCAQKRKITPGEISKVTSREPHSTSKIISRMEKEGYISKETGQGKKRNEVHLTLTEKGEQAYQSSLNRDSIREVMSDFSQAERHELNALLTRLRNKALQDLTQRKNDVFP
jgi:DNA-binding MarR family transcriptional regulator